MNPKLIIVSAPSGAGKTTLCDRLLKEYGDRLELSISFTTRAPRGEGDKREREGFHYHFISNEQFEELKQKNRFAEWAKVHDYFYGTSRDVIEGAFLRGKSVLLDIDVQGAESLRKAYPNEAISFFVAPPSVEILEQRLRARGTESEAVIQKRMTNARRELAEAPKFHHVIVNDDLQRAYEELKSIASKILLGLTE